MPLDPPGPLPLNPPADLGLRIKPETAQINGEYYVVYVVAGQKEIFKVRILEKQIIGGLFNTVMLKFHFADGHIEEILFTTLPNDLQWAEDWAGSQLYTIGHAVPMNVNNNMGQNGGRKRKSRRNRKSRKSRGRK